MLNKNGRNKNALLRPICSTSHTPHIDISVAAQLPSSRMLHHRIQCVEQKEVSLLNSPAYKELLSPFYQPISQELFEWTNSPYEKNDNYLESLKHKAVSGGYVRSKSEQIIDMVLYKNKIPFRYECALRFGETVFYPDFTIRHPKTGQLFYWEHFGLMDDADYSKKAYSKLQTYTSHGLIPTIQLITTYETKEHPLSIEAVEEIVNYYFLS